MTAAITIQDFDRHLLPRHRLAKKLALRRRAAEHPIVMFTIAATVSLLSMALMPGAGPALVSPQTASHGATHAIDRADRLPLSATDTACQGQAWGAETEDCIASIAEESGKADHRKVRKLAFAEAAESVPNIF